MSFFLILVLGSTNMIETGKARLVGVSVSWRAFEIRQNDASLVSW
jgi:hypothetical protein